MAPSGFQRPWTHSHPIMPRTLRQVTTHIIDMAVKPEEGGKLAYERLKYALPVASRGGGGPKVENLCACFLFFLSFFACAPPLGVRTNKTKTNPSRMENGPHSPHATGDSRPDCALLRISSSTPASGDHPNPAAGRMPVFGRIAEV